MKHLKNDNIFHIFDQIINWALPSLHEGSVEITLTAVTLIRQG